MYEHNTPKQVIDNTIETLKLLIDAVDDTITRKALKAWLATYPLKTGEKITEKKVVDLSVLVESGIDCLFWDNTTSKGAHVSKLTRLKRTPHMYSDTRDVGWLRCTPRLDHWHSWQGGECPLPEGINVEVTTRCGYKGGISGSDAHWGHAENINSQWNQYDIIAFRIPSDKPLSDGHIWPWEA